MSIPNQLIVPNYDDNALRRYLTEINKIPVLAPDEEYVLAKNYQEYNDIEAAHKLVASHLRLVAKIAMGYRGYGLPIGEVISEGNIGLMQAVKKFEPDKGFRLATYAMWWIKAAIQEYVLRSWSLVKIGTTTNQKKLFFNLRKVKNKIANFDDLDLNQAQVKYIAKELNVAESDVISMNQRMLGDASLNAKISVGDGESAEWEDWLTDDSKNQEQLLIDASEHNNYVKILDEAISRLTPREAEIFKERRLREDPVTLETLAGRFGISRERVRQIEVKPMKRYRKLSKNPMTLYSRDNFFK